MPICRYAMHDDRGREGCHVEPVERSAKGRLLTTGRKTSLRCQE